MRLSLVVVLMFAAAALATDGAYRFWPPSQRAKQAAFEKRLNEVPTPASLRAYHEMIGQKPHYAGTANDLAAAGRLAAEFEKLGLEVGKQELWVYLAEPVRAAVEVVTPVKIELPLQEISLPEDPYSDHPQLGPGWNAYSGSGDVTGQVVYANYGTEEDFEKLAELGVQVTGKIVIARYGGNYRGYKAKYAKQWGAAGLIIYTDPADSGYARGIMYPEGGYATPSYIQRGSIKTLPYAGDALTPGWPATHNARRLDPEHVALPRIPVQPIGWGAASEILHRMDGPAVPDDWQGGLPFAYRLTGGEGLTVRLMVNQKRENKKTFNVVGYLRGATWPDEWVIVGCHHDAWTFGAGDPLAGTMVLYECAKSFAELARRGERPARTIVFANWGAEEFGIIGSTEWVEAHRDELSDHGVAYINLDMAAMGPDFRSSAAPLLKSVIADATRAVPAVEPSPAGGTMTVYDTWLGRDEDELLPGHPDFGSLGGGSDHVGFYCHLAIPSAGLSAGGAKGISYHSNYDNLAWYRKVVGESYEPARMVTRVTNLVVARLVNAPLLPLDPRMYGPDVRRHMEWLANRGQQLGIAPDFERLEDDVAAFQPRAEHVYGELLERIGSGRLSADALRRVNRELIQLERQWIVASGLPEREWYRNLFAATDETSGYASWMLPGFRYAVEHKLPAANGTARRAYHRVFVRLNESLDRIEAALNTATGADEHSSR